MTDRSVKKYSLPLTARSIKDHGTPIALISLEDHHVEVLPHGDQFVAIHRDADHLERARGYGPTPEDALEDLRNSLY